MLIEGKNKRGLTMNPMQERFCIEYVIDNNAVQASYRAGYKSPKMGAQLLQLKKVQDRITELRATDVPDDLLTIRYIITNLKEVVERCMKPQPVMIWNNVTKTVDQERDDKGQLVYKFDSMGVNKALELLGRYKGMFDKGLSKGAGITNNAPQITDEQFQQLITAALTNKEGQ